METTVSFEEITKEEFQEYVDKPTLCRDGHIPPSIKVGENEYLGYDGRHYITEARS